VDAQTFAALRPCLDQINAWYRDLEGERAAAARAEHGAP
jgi:hypothetical protein